MNKAIIDGKIVLYDTASTMPLKIAIQSHSKSEYVGSSFEFIVGNKRITSKNEHHFFKKIA